MSKKTKIRHKRRILNKYIYKYLMSFASVGLV